MGESNSRSAENRMLILYTLNEVAYPLTYHDLSFILMDSLLMQFGDFNESARFLLDEGYLQKSEEGFLDITPEGIRMLSILEENPGSRKKKIINEYLREKGSEISGKNSVSSGVEAVGEGKYLLTLEGKEGRKTAIVIKMELPDKNMAEKMANRWRKDYGSVYESLLNSLSKDGLDHK